MNKILYILIFTTLLFSSSDAEQYEIEYVIKPQFDYADAFSEGLARVEIGERWGYINKEGQYVANPSFSIVTVLWIHQPERTICYQPEGLALVTIGERWGYINKEGQYIIKLQFDNIGNSFSEGLVHVEISDKWGYINKEGQFVIKPQFDGAGSFLEGLAPVKIGDKWGYISKESFEK